MGIHKQEVAFLKYITWQEVVPQHVHVNNESYYYQNEDYSSEYVPDVTTDD